LAGDPLQARLYRAPRHPLWSSQAPWAARRWVAAEVLRESLAQSGEGDDARASWQAFLMSTPLSLELWLRGRSSAGAVSG
jgi:hypothetical protein